MAQCVGCGHELSGRSVEALERRQVFDIPPISVQVCEHRAQIKTCPCCSLRNKAVFPESVTQPVQYGVELQAVATYLSQYQMVPFKRLQELFIDVFQIPLSQGTLDSILNRGHENLEDFEQQAAAGNSRSLSDPYYAVTPMIEIDHTLNTHGFVLRAQ